MSERGRGRERGRGKYLETVLDEGLGVVEPLEEDLGSSHGHLEMNHTGSQSNSVI